MKQAAHNEATFRLANERIEQKVAELGLGESPTPYLCECEEPTCTKVVELTREEYESVRAHAKRFLMVAGHQESEDRVIEDVGRVGIEPTTLGLKVPCSTN